MTPGDAGMCQDLGVCLGLGNKITFFKFRERLQNVLTVNHPVWIARLPTLAENK